LRTPQHGESGRGRRRGPRAEGAAEPSHKATGLPARRFAVALIEAVLQRGMTLDEALAAPTPSRDLAMLEARDRAFARLIASTVVRHLGVLEQVLGHFLQKPLPKDAGRARSILLAASAQLLFIATPAHAVINLAVEQCRRDRLARRFDKLANAVLRRVAAEGPAIRDSLDAPRLDIPAWLWRRWSAAYGEPIARRIAEASLREAPLDVTVKDDAAGWAERLHGHVVSGASIRLLEPGRIEELPGYEDGAWWVQDAAAALPARLLGSVRGLRVADLCAAPGGKTAQLASAGAMVTAVDASAKRLAVLRENVRRLRIETEVEVVEADVASWSPARRFDAILLDAPCTATGTLRRHPDILRLKHEEDVSRLAALQARLLRRAADLVAPGGTLIYCTCSLQPEEGEQQVERFLEDHRDYARAAIDPAELGGAADWISPAGDLRTLPHHLRLEHPDLSGMDGFYAARLKRAP
jgi:16S rRNA (cytosine967-C5)-methyltransferase